MAKAQLTTRSGTLIVIEGSPDEVTRMLAKFEPRHAGKEGGRDADAGEPRKTGLGGHVSELIDGDFFNKPRGLAEIKAALEEHGHHYPVTTLSPALLRLVRRKELRRIKDKKRWTYVR